MFEESVGKMGRQIKKTKRRGELSVRTIIAIIILVATLVLLFLFVSSKGKFLFDIWGRGPLG